MTSYISSNEFGEAISKEEDLERLRKELGEILAGKRTPHMAGIDTATVLTPHETIYIVAGNYAEFVEYREKKLEEWRRRAPAMKGHPVRQHQYICVHDHTVLFGLTEIKGYYIGSYKEREDYPQIKHKIDSIKAMENQKGNGFE